MECDISSSRKNSSLVFFINKKAISPFSPFVYNIKRQLLNDLAQLSNKSQNLGSAKPNPI
jgi:hypothetical protein